MKSNYFYIMLACLFKAKCLIHIMDTKANQSPYRLMRYIQQLILPANMIMSFPLYFVIASLT